MLKYKKWCISTDYSPLLNAKILKKNGNTRKKDILRGGQLLVKESDCEDIFTPEDFTEEQQMMRDAVKEFNDREIIPYKDRFEKKDMHSQNSA